MGLFHSYHITTATIVSVENHQYHYEPGVFFKESDVGYVIVVASPAGATIEKLSEGAEVLRVGDQT